MTKDKRQRTNVLQLTGSFEQGGSERQAVQLTKLLHEDGEYRVFLATLNRTGNLLEEVEKLGFNEIPEFKLNSFYNRNFFSQLRNCARFIKQNNIEIVHAHDFYTNVFGILSARLAGVKARISSKRETDGMRSGSQKTVEKQIFRLSSKITVNAEAVKKYLLEKGINERKISTIYNGLDLERLKPQTTNRSEILQAFGLPENKKIVTIVANLRHEVKNIPMFFKMAQKVSQMVENSIFVVAGEGALLPKMQELAKELKIADNIFFLGRCAKVAELLEVSNVCVLSSLHEGFSNSILEYMSAAKPVVATNVGGASEAIIENETGFLVESDNDSQMAEKIAWLLQNSEKAEVFGKKGREIVEQKFSCEAQLKNVKMLYGGLLS